MQLCGGKPKKGTSIIQWDYIGSLDQQWMLIPFQDNDKDSNEMKVSESANILNSNIIDSMKPLNILFNPTQEYIFVLNLN